VSKHGVVALALLVCAFPIVALADLSGTATLQSNAALNLDTGATSASGGDLLWNGSTLAPQGNATAYNFGNAAANGQTLYNGLTQASVLNSVTTLGSKAAINSSALGAGDVLVVHTNGGNYAKILVLSNSNGTLGLQYTTFGATGGGGGGTPTMTITEVENAATNIPAGLPNSPVAQGSMMVIKGTLLGPSSIAIASVFPLKTTIGGTSVSVTVGGTTVDAIMFYALASQVAAILPSRTPPGTGTVKVTYNGQSATAPITVVPSNFGMYTLDSSGTGDAVAYLNSNSSLITPTNAANPGDVIVFWGTGLGPVASDETQPAVQADMANVPVEVFVGGQPQSAKVVFHGRNGCCSSADTIYIVVPDGVTGCAVSVVVRVNNVISNTSSIAIAKNGRSCTPVSGTTPGNVSGSHSIGGITLQRLVSTNKQDVALGVFEKITPNSTVVQGSQIDVNAFGSCTVSTSYSGQPAVPPAASIQYLDAGTLTIAGPGITDSKTFTKLTGGGTQTYLAQLDSTATTFAQGTYTIKNGAGGADVKAFTATYNMPAPFSWTNQSAFSNVDRNSGAYITWSGGDPAGYVLISGSSTAYVGPTQTVTGAFTCTARVSDLNFNVPPIVLLSLPASSPPPGSTTPVPGTLSVSSFSGYQTFTAQGIDLGSLISAYAGSAQTLYQ
jgi:uncharacterized protein (TIGR03437 family)